MSKKKMLLISQQYEQNDKLTPLAHDNFLETRFASNEETAIESLQQQAFDVVVIDGTGTLHARKLQAIIPILQPDALMLNYEGEETAVLHAKVLAALREKRNERIMKLMILDTTGSAGILNPMLFSAN